MSMHRRWAKRMGLGAAGVLVVSVPALADTAQAPGPLDAAAAWRDTIEGYRAPDRVPVGDAEEVIVILADASASAVPPAERAAAAAAISKRQDELVPVLEQLGAKMTMRYRILLNGFSVQVPRGQVPAIAALADVEAVIPVAFLSPAGVAGDAPVVTTDPVEPRPVPQPTAGPAHIALIDAGVDSGHAALGGGMGPTSLILGGADLVQGDPDPTGDGTADAHGTGMAGLVLRSAALEGLEPEKMPRLLAYRVVAPEIVDGRTLRLARTDRILAAMERAVDPDQNGDTADRSEVILIGLANGFGGAGMDPLSRAADAADRVGAVVVAPAGNDGPTQGPSGSVGALAGTPAVLAVGALGATTAPRTATLTVELGPAGAALEALPLMGASPDGAAAPIVLLSGEEGAAAGLLPADYRDAAGESRVNGAIAVVGRAGGSLAEKARNAAAAGAVGLVVWDQAGDGAFPGRGAGADWPIPVVGVGAAQGTVLSDAIAVQPGLVASLGENPAGGAPAAGVATFSSRGPAADGRAKPDLVAPGVERPAAYPGKDAEGRPLATLMTGSSASAAEVAALALRLRVDRPDLAAVEVRSLLVQAARAVPGAGVVDAGAGEATPATPRPIAIDPPVLTFPRGITPERVTVALSDLTGSGGRYRVVLDTGVGEGLPVGDVIEVNPGTRRGIVFRVAGGREPLVGRLLVLPEAGGEPVAWAPLVALPPPAPPAGALGVPAVRVAAGVAQVEVAIGARRREGESLAAATLHDVGFWLVPAAGGEPLRVSGARQKGNWPAGTYRVLLSGRLANGLEVAPGRYRVRVTATAPDGTALSSESDPFRL
jgi:minor extracellular serine protease Vpr